MTKIDVILIYTIEGDDAIHLKVGGVKIGAFGPSTEKAIALLKLETELRAARTRSVEPPREMIERAEKWLRANDLTSPAFWPEHLAAEFTAIRTQAIEECAGVAEQTDGDIDIEVTDSNGKKARERVKSIMPASIAAAIRGFL